MSRGKIAAEAMQIIIALLVVAWMVWISKDIWRRGFGSGLVIGLLMAVLGNDSQGETKTYGVLLMITCGALLILYRIMTK